MLPCYIDGLRKKLSLVRSTLLDIFSRNSICCRLREFCFGLSCPFGICRITSLRPFMPCNAFQVDARKHVLNNRSSAVAIGLDATPDSSDCDLADGGCENASHHSSASDHSDPCNLSATSSASDDIQHLVSRNVSVLVIGAGTAGLSAARHLVDSGAFNSTGAGENCGVTILEARDRAGGRVFTETLPGLPELGLPEVLVDVGASVMHGCADDNQSVFKLALKEKIRAPVVAGGLFYECTEHARWFDENGKAIDTRLIVEIHSLFWIIGRCLAAMARASDDFTADLESHYLVAKEYVLRRLGGRILSPVENKILDKIRTRSYAYCAPMASMALHQAALGADPNDDPVVGSSCDTDHDLGMEDAANFLSLRRINSEATRLKKALRSADNPVPCRASRRNLPGDRIVLDGYTPFLIDKLKLGLDIKYNTVAQHIRYRRNVIAEGMKAVEVITTRGEIYEADFVIVTLPIGVLQGRNQSSAVQFLPPLSDEKRMAIQTLGMGVHNKVILRFHPDDVFWPPNTPQINCLDRRFQFLNLHAYGKFGVLLTHIFGGTEFAHGFDGLNDCQVVAETLRVLEKMFFGSAKHKDTIREVKSEVENCFDSSSEAGSNARNRKSETERMHSLNDCRSDVCQQTSTPQPSHPRTKEGTRARDFLPYVVELVEAEGILNNGIGETMKHERSDNHPECGALHSCNRGSYDVSRMESSTSTSCWKESHCADNIQALDGSGLNNRRRPSKFSIPRKKRRYTKQRRPSKMPSPLQTIVTRWDQDPFSLGSYSYLPCGADWDMIEEMATPEPPNVSNPTLFFAGEHCDDPGWQCVHGAFESGKSAANGIIEKIVSGNDGDSIDENEIQPNSFGSRTTRR